MINIKWKISAGINKQLESVLRPHLIKNGEYGNLTSARLHEIKQLAEKHELKHKQLLSMRVAYLRDKVISRYQKLVDHRKTIWALYSEGTDVVSISKQYDYPPVTIFRTILQEKGLSKKNIKTVLNNPISLSDRDQQQLQMAIDNDIITDPDNTMKAEAAEIFEDRVVKFFKFKGVKLQTQNDLVKEQTELVGRAVLTPDLYFPDGVKIDGHVIYWLDAKNYYGADVYYIRESVKKQADKYNNAYGSGAFVFKYGYSAELARKINAMFLST